MQDHKLRRVIRSLEQTPPDIQAAIQVCQDELELNAVMRAKQDSFLPAPEPEPLPLFQFEMEDQHASR